MKERCTKRGRDGCNGGDIKRVRVRFRNERAQWFNDDDERDGKHAARHPLSPSSRISRSGNAQEAVDDVSNVFEARSIDRPLIVVEVRALPVCVKEEDVRASVKDGVHTRREE